jgi:hypothetical protein
MVPYMFKLACWVAVVSMSVSSHVLSLDIISTTLVNFCVLTFTFWIILDGIVVAMDLRAAEAELKNMQAQLRYHEYQTQTHVQLNNATVRHMKESYEIMVEVRNRLISLNNKLKNQGPISTPGSLDSASCSTFSLSTPDLFSGHRFTRSDRRNSSL